MKNRQERIEELETHMDSYQFDTRTLSRQAVGLIKELEEENKKLKEQNDNQTQLIKFLRNDR